MCSGGEEDRRALLGREADLARREAILGAREAALDERMRSAHEILAAADQRDVTTDARDAAAGQRETDLDRAEFLGAEEEYGDHWPERRAANLDRTHSKEDRWASRDDRIALSGTDNAPEAEQR